MADSAQVKSLSIRHEAIMDYLLAHPTASRSEVAAHFGVTRPWLSVIIHSDAFQAKLREKQGEIFVEAVVSPIQDKLAAVAHMATERIMDLIPFESDVNKVNNAMETALELLGYGQKVKGAPVGGTVNNTQINIYQPTAGELARARELMARTGAGAGATEEAPLNGQLERDDVPGLPAPRDDSEGEGDRAPRLRIEEVFTEAAFSEGTKVRV